MIGKPVRRGEIFGPRQPAAGADEFADLPQVTPGLHLHFTFRGIDRGAPSDMTGAGVADAETGQRLIEAFILGRKRQVIRMGGQLVSVLAQAFGADACPFQRRLLRFSADATGRMGRNAHAQIALDGALDLWFGQAAQHGSRRRGFAVRRINVSRRSAHIKEHEALPARHMLADGAHVFEHDIRCGCRCRTRCTHDAIQPLAGDDGVEEDRPDRITRRIGIRLVEVGQQVIDDTQPFSGQKFGNVFSDAAIPGIDDFAIDG